MPATIPFGEWTPDHSAFHHADMDRASEAKGVYPATDHSYGPFPSFSTISSNALSARAQGAWSGRDKNGDTWAFAGDATKLYRRSGVAWSDVSKTATTYGVTSEEHWQFVQIGDRLIALNLADYPQLFTLSSSTNFVDLGTTTWMPKARYGAQIADWLVLANFNDVSAVNLGLAPSRLWWSEKGNCTSFPEPGTSSAAAAQSGYTSELPGGWIQGITSAVGGAAGAVFSEDAIHRIIVAGPPAVFEFDLVEGARGCWVASSIHNFGPGVLYLAEDGWYVFNGTSAVPIGTRRVDRWFLDRLDVNNKHRITVVSDPERKLVVISFPGDGSVGGTPNELLIWNWEANKWSHADATVAMLFHDHTSGYTLEDLDAFGTLETLPYSLDSRAWAGGLSQIGAFFTDHKSGTFSGTNQAATVITQDFDGKGQRIFVTGFRPVVDGGTVTGALAYRDTQSAAVAFTPSSGQGVDGICRVRAEGRYVRARVDIAAGGVWTHAHGVQTDDAMIRLTGRR
jgi:hypothetical protein